jgi:hypothetical protein
MSLNEVYGLSFEVFMVMTVQIVVFCVVTSCSFVGRCQWFGAA